MRIREKFEILARRAWPDKRGQPARQPALASEALVEAFSDLGIEPGDILMVHSSWERASALAPTPSALVTSLQAAIGPSGTLSMPAYPRLSPGDPKVFDVRKAPSNAGLLTEVFRRMPGVLRSGQLRSVAAFGPMAAKLTSEHHLSPYASGKRSPYATLAALGGKVLCLGVGPESNTMFHCGEDILESEFPVAVYEDGLTDVRVVKADGTSMTIRVYERSTRWTYCCDAVRLLPYMRDAIRWRTINGVEAYLVPADQFLERLLALARAGIHMYGFHFPSPRHMSDPPQFSDGTSFRRVHLDQGFRA